MKALEKILPGLKRWLHRQPHVKRIIHTFGFEMDGPHYRFKVRPSWFEESSEHVDGVLRELLSKLEEIQAEGFQHARAEGFAHEMERESLVEFHAPLDFEHEGADRRDQYGPLVARYVEGKLHLV